MISKYLSVAFVLAIGIADWSGRAMAQANSALQAPAAITRPDVAMVPALRRREPVLILDQVRAALPLARPGTPTTATQAQQPATGPKAMVRPLNLTIVPDQPNEPIFDASDLAQRGIIKGETPK